MSDLHQNQPVPSPGPSTATPSSTNTPNGRIFASVLRSAATYTSDELFNPNTKGVRLFVDATVVAGGGTLIVSVEVRDPVTDTWVPITSATSPTGVNAWASVQTRLLTLYPGITAAAGTATTNTEVSTHLGCAWRVKAVVGTADVTFSIGAEYLL